MKSVTSKYMRIIIFNLGTSVSRKKFLNHFFIQVSALTFSPDGEFLYSHGFGGEVYIWDIKNQECVHKFVDDGCVKGILFLFTFPYNLE